MERLISNSHTSVFYAHNVTRIENYTKLACIIMFLRVFSVGTMYWPSVYFINCCFVIVTFWYAHIYS